MPEQTQTKILTLKGRAFFTTGDKAVESKEAKLNVYNVPTDIIVFVPGTKLENLTFNDEGLAKVKIKLR